MLVDSGNVAGDPALAAVVLKAMALMGYDALGVGVMEAALGQEMTDLVEETGVPLVGKTGPEAGKAEPARLTCEIGDRKVAVVCAAWAPDPEVEDYRVRVRQLLESARDEADFVVLLSQLGRDEDKQLLSSEGFANLADVVVGGPVSWYQDKPEFVGSTLLLPGSRQGREVGVLEVKFTDGRVRYHHEMIRLVSDIPEDPQVQSLVNEYYEKRLERPQTGVVVTSADSPPLPGVFSEQEADAIRARGYLTASECGRCHDEQLKQWQSTSHANALQTLRRERRTVRECLVCHSEANRRGLPYNPDQADRWGVDCAACHGAGLYHASSRGEPNTIVRKPGETVCRRCHTQERDTKFSMEVRLPLVAH